MKESTVTALIFSLLTLAAAISLTIVAPAHSKLPVCSPQAVAPAACR